MIKRNRIPSPLGQFIHSTITTIQYHQVLQQLYHYIVKIHARHYFSLLLSHSHYTYVKNVHIPIPNPLNLRASLLSTIQCSLLNPNYTYTNKTFASIHPKYRNITLRELLRKLRCGEPIELLLLQALDLLLIHAVAGILDHPVGFPRGRTPSMSTPYPRLQRWCTPRFFIQFVNFHIKFTERISNTIFCKSAVKRRTPINRQRPLSFASLLSSLFLSFCLCVRGMD